MVSDAWYCPTPLERSTQAFSTLKPPMIPLKLRRTWRNKCVSLSPMARKRRFCSCCMKQAWWHQAAGRVWTYLPFRCRNYMQFMCHNCIIDVQRMINDDECNANFSHWSATASIWNWHVFGFLDVAIIKSAPSCPDVTSPGAVGKALVFASTKRMCEDLANQLHHSGVSCAAIHGDKDTTTMARY